MFLFFSNIYIYDFCHLTIELLYKNWIYYWTAAQFIVIFIFLNFTTYLMQYWKTFYNFMFLFEIEKTQFLCVLTNLHLVKPSHLVFAWQQISNKCRFGQKETSERNFAQF